MRNHRNDRAPQRIQPPDLFRPKKTSGVFTFQNGLQYSQDRSLAKGDYLKAMNAPLCDELAWTGFFFCPGQSLSTKLRWVAVGVEMEAGR